ncbi:MAG: 5-formyltetrahydrofolate cyclo-ligase [Myxococcales bacterium]|jgi:5-formyltetrahydrofolate cyclo-ligase|nr:5-formyltetrahydrofolate cyclo-ligase [Myxococcales bacterium]
MSADSTDEMELLARRFKEATRERIKRTRLATPPEARLARAAKIAENVRTLPEFGAARTVLAYAAVRGEADVGALEADVRARGGRWVLPRVEGSSLTLHEVPEGEPLVPGAFGIPEPSPSFPVVAPEDVDFALIPALAVDERGHRIGWGGGFYDRLLGRLTCAFRCAVVYDFQLIAEAPVQGHDVAVDAVVSERQCLIFGRG